MSRGVGGRVEDILAPIRGKTQIVLPRQYRRSVAIVGAGAIVCGAHIPAYRQLEVEIRGIYDRERLRAEEVAALHSIDRVYLSLDEILDDAAVEVIDVAVTPWWSRRLS